MESVRVRGCVVGAPGPQVQPRRQADASRRRNGPRKTVAPELAPAPRRSRCGLEVSPASSPPSDMRGRREKGSSGGEAAERLSRRLWGRRPGRPDGLHPSPATQAGVAAAAHLEAVEPNDREVHRWTSCVNGPALRAVGPVPRVTSRRSSPGWRSTTTAIIRVEVEVEKERNPRQADRAVRVELTAFSKGPVIRAEAAAEDKMAALDLALDKMAAQMRRAADRRRVHHGRHTPVVGRRRPSPTSPDADDGDADDDGVDRAPGRPDHGDRRRPARGPREDRTPPTPMTLDQALYEMELVGHDFYLFVDKESERPVGRLPPPRLRLRRDLPRRRG